jgi:hypothetical protein
MASGNHMCKGNIALLPAPPININTTPHDNADMPKKEAAAADFNPLESGDVNVAINVLKSRVPE